jgi:hypothetical protein
MEPQDGGMEIWASNLTLTFGTGNLSLLFTLLFLLFNFPYFFLCLECPGLFLCITQISMPPAGFETAIPAGEMTQAYALDCTATGTGQTFDRHLVVQCLN